MGDMPGTERERRSPPVSPVPEVRAFAPVADSRPDDLPWPAMRWPVRAGAELRGRVVTLRPADPDRDAEELHLALDHDPVWRHLAARQRDPAGWTRALRRSIDAGRHPWTVRLVREHAGLAAGTVVGTSSYLDASPPDARLEIGSTAYVPAAWGTAVNPETKLLLLGYAFEELRCGRVQLKTDVRNVRSQQAIARLGARCEGTLRRYQRRDDDTVRDTVMFSLLAEEWPLARRHLEARVDELASQGPGTR